MPTVSIIVPVYNTEQYLRRCIDSILSQSFTDFELLLIDDGSKDSSGSICDDYAAKDNRIRVFHKENGGVSSARNLGLDNAKGEWIYFVDADDEVVSDGVMRLVEGMKHDVDIVLGGFVEIDEDGRIIKPIKYTDRQFVMSPKECLLSNYWNSNIEQSYSGYLWIWLYKRSVIQKFGLRFQSKIAFKEDTLFIVQYICRGVRKGYYIGSQVYRYRASATSICQICRIQYDKKYNSSFDACEQMLMEIRATGIEDVELKELAESLLFNRYYMIRSKMREFNRVDKKELANLRRRMKKQLGFYCYYQRTCRRLADKGRRYIKRHLLKTLK